MIFFEILRKLIYYYPMKNKSNDWKLIIKNPGVIETSFGSISFMPPEQNTQKDFIHPPVKVSSVGKAKYKQYSEGGRDE
tara:strand:+ start:3646 stop:3882 length:237 start_codon:yes stop_codon:yes gene_type:complete